MPEGPWCLTKSGAEYCNITHCSKAKLQSRIIPLPCTRIPDACPHCPVIKFSLQLLDSVSQVTASCHMLDLTPQLIMLVFTGPEMLYSFRDLSYGCFLDLILGQKWKTFAEIPTMMNICGVIVHISTKNPKHCRRYLVRILQVHCKAAVSITECLYMYYNH